MRLSIIAYSVNSLFQVVKNNKTNAGCSNQLRSSQTISVNTNLNLQPINNNLVKLLFTKFEVCILTTDLLFIQNFYRFLTSTISGNACFYHSTLRTYVRVLNHAVH